MKFSRMMLVTTLMASLAQARASDVGHFVGGAYDIRDYFVPAQSGVYAGIYNYFYQTERYNNNNGDKLTIGPAGAISFDVNMYAVSPLIMWVCPQEILGAKYGAYLAPSFVNSSLNANINTALNRGGSVSESSFGVGDLYAQPLWLDWGLAHWDLMVAYGFYAPIGKYSTETLGGVMVENPGNLGLGYWTQQIQAGVAWYPWTNQATAVTAVLTYEYNSPQQDTGIRYGQLLTLNWGISQYLPLTKDENLLLEIGPAGYDSFQISDNTGPSAGNPGDRSQVQAVGGQIGLTYVPWDLALDFHGFYEYYAANRIQGASFGINIVKKF